MGVKRVKRCTLDIVVVGDFGSTEPAFNGRFPTLCFCHIVRGLVKLVNCPAEFRAGDVLHSKCDQQPFISYAVTAHLLPVCFGHDFAGLTAHLEGAAPAAHRAQAVPAEVRSVQGKPRASVLAVRVVALEFRVIRTLRNSAGLVQIVGGLRVVRVASEDFVNVGQALRLTFPFCPRSFCSIRPQVVQAFRLLHFFGRCDILVMHKKCPLVSVIWLVSQPHYSTGRGVFQFHPSKSPKSRAVTG